ncbi:MAG: hypothetical protein ABR867_00285 [Nitrososphaerales archaeon]
MSEILLLHLLLGFVSGWLIVAAVTAIADAYGTGKAGFLGGLPSTGAVGLFFIGWSQSQEAAVRATSVFPLAFSVTFAFLLFYSLPRRGGFASRITTALLLWFLLSVLVVLLHFDNFGLSLGISVLVSSIVFLIHTRIGIQDYLPVESEFNLRQTALRGALGGWIVSLVVILTAVGGPLVGGVFAAAPVVWTSSLYLTSRAHGVEFSRSLTKSFMVAGILTVIPYSVAARYLFSAVGVLWGTVFAYIAISPEAWLAWRLVRGRERTKLETGSLPMQD